ncbi:MAG: type VII secretion protein EssC [Defluviitaleaceae bacterium]|nr:type VII secretion protein EssC [Defluviitaleaceae bacterium]
MPSLIIFGNKHCHEFSINALPSQLPLDTNSLKGLNPDQPFTNQVQPTPNQIFILNENQQALLHTAAEQHFSTIGTTPIRIGPSPSTNVSLSDTVADFAILPQSMDVFDSNNLYLNGKKIPTGNHLLQAGDSIWAGSTKIIVHESYISCTGDNYISNLNISTHTPEKYEEFPIYKRSPRIIKREPTETVEITAPKEKGEKKKGELIKTILPPLAMIAVTITVGILMGRGLFMLASAGMMSVSMVFSITTFIGDSKTRKEKEKERLINYDNYLLTRRKKIHELHEAQKDSLLYHNLSLQEIEREIKSYSSRLYERATNDSDFLTLSMGYSTIPISYKLQSPAGNTGETNKDALVTEMRALVDSYQNLDNMPTVIDLKHAHLGLVGEKAYIHRQLAAIMTQLCFFQSYLDIEIILLVEEEYWQKFEWVRWYPHCRIKNINITGLVSAENQRDQVLGNVAQMLKMRKQKQDEEKKDSRFMPHYIFIIDNPKLIINHSIMEYLQTPDTTLGFSMIYTTHIQANLPENIRTVFMLDGGDRGHLLMNEGVLINRPVTLYKPLEEHALENISRKLAPIRHSQGVSTQIPESVTFFELYNAKRPEDIPILRQWEQNASHKSLAVPLGLRGTDDIISLNLHEKAHGPHGLVAGTTGSGKSEIVQSYILSLGVNFHPHEVGFLLIDYKGGGMANLFANLPHLLGTITNLDGSESMRALASIKSELARRQRVFGDFGVNNINQYSKLLKSGDAPNAQPMPHLFIISDEFAELKKEQPDFMTELVSAARIGRSLGVHLILATQKPTGVVDDQIWSNSKFKLALKVANEADSNEILKTPDAARITQPGRAYLQVGNNEIYELFQSAYSGAPFSEEVVKRGFDSRVYAINKLGQGELLNDDLSEVDASEDSKLTQLDVIVNHIQEIYSGLEAITVEKPWLPPLGDKLVTSHISRDVDVGLINSHNLSVAVGMVDIPEQQAQMEYFHHFMEDGNFAVFSASGFGKSTLVMNIALTLASNNSPKLLNYFVLDYGNSALAQLRELPYTADYLTFDDEEKLDKLVKLLTEELKKRKSLFAAVSAINFKMYNEVAKEKLPAILIIIDNYDVIKEVGNELEEFLIKLTRDGTGLGIYTTITASRYNAVRYSVINNFKNKIAQYMFDSSDITAVTGRSAYTLPDIRGRALVKMQDVHIAQCYLPAPYDNDVEYTKEISRIISEITTNNSASKAAGIRIVPDVVTYDDLIPFLKTNERQLVLGFDIESTDPMYFDLSIPCQMVVGSPSTGKTNILKLIAMQLEGMSIYVSDSKAGDLHGLEGQAGITYMGAGSQFNNFYEKLESEVEQRQQLQASSGMRQREFIVSQPLVLVLIDDGDTFIEYAGPKTREMETLIPKAMELGINFIITTLPSRMRGFDNLTKILKDAQGGIVLGNPNDQSILQVTAPRGYKPVQDIGFWFKRGDIRQVKLPIAGSINS